MVKALLMWGWMGWRLGWSWWLFMRATHVNIGQMAQDPHPSLAAPGPVRPIVSCGKSGLPCRLFVDLGRVERPPSRSNRRFPSGGFVKVEYLCDPLASFFLGTWVHRGRDIPFDSLYFGNASSGPTIRSLASRSFFSLLDPSVSLLDRTTRDCWNPYPKCEF